MICAALLLALAGDFRAAAFRADVTRPPTSRSSV
jgi:hypothetical protein